MSPHRHEPLNRLRAFYISPFQSDLLDLSRWLAALLVVVEHLRSLIFADYGVLGKTGSYWKLFYFITGFGHSAVMIFFVMSGFLVGGKALERLMRGSFSWRKYAVDRGSRLYAVYLLALLLGGVLDYLGYSWFNRFGLYDQSFPGRIAVVNANFHSNLSWPTFILNLGMCQTVLGPVFGSNGPLWSLANEFWYYLAAPLLFPLLLNIRSRTALVKFGLLAALFCLLPRSMLTYFLVWLMGAALSLINFRQFLPGWCSLLLLLASLTIARFQWLQMPYLADFLIGVSFALVVNSAAADPKRLPWHAVSRKAADFSYSVYLCHFPFVVFGLSALDQTMGNGLHMTPGALAFGLFLVALAVTYAWCYLISLATERQTYRIRDWIFHRLGGAPN